MKKTYQGKKLFLCSSFTDVAGLLNIFEKNLKGKIVTFIPTASKGSTPLYVWLVIILADLSKSTPPIKPIIEVSFNKVINSLTKAGKIFFIACGTIIFLIV